MNRAKFCTGRGNAAKDEVLAAAIKRWPELDIADNNQADALILAMMGAQWAGAITGEFPSTHLAALEKCEWPSLSS
jgi:crossover junction endodeoxyribonuclease RuvC